MMTKKDFIDVCSMILGLDEQIKELYKQRDEMLKGLVVACKSKERMVEDSETGEEYWLKDQFADRVTCFRTLGFSRWVVQKE
jgi:hypothetical protein